MTKPTQEFVIELPYVVTLVVKASSLTEAVNTVRMTDIYFNTTTTNEDVEVVTVDQSDDTTLSWLIDGEFVDVSGIQ